MSSVGPELPESHLDLLDAPGVGVLSTIGAGGHPQSTAIWYLRDGDVIRFTMDGTRQKYRNLVERPRATLFILDPTNRYRSIEIRADVELDDDPDLEFMHRVFHHYGSDPADLPVTRRIIATLLPRRVVTLS